MPNQKKKLVEACQLLDKTDLESGHTMSFSAYHASMLNASSEMNTALMQILPLFL